MKRQKKKTLADEVTEIDLSDELAEEQQTDLLSESNAETPITEETKTDAKIINLRMPGALFSPPPINDDLKLIKGIGNVLEETLHNFGIYTFLQIGKWTDEDIDFIDSAFEQFRGRIRREKWVESAKEEHFKKYDERL